MNKKAVIDLDSLKRQGNTNYKGKPMNLAILV